MLQVEFKRVEVMFPAADERRQYALDSAPLRRVALKSGEMLETHQGEVIEVDEVIERDGLLVYLCGGREIEEAGLSDTMSFNKPEDRLFGGHVDGLHAYDLRVEALRRQCEVMKSPARGFAGARMDLIPHQLYIADEVSSRVSPRVMLADEVGLGKTIEACLVMHRLHLTGRADRVLILVPEPLLHQWFVELLRRFNMLFSLFDEPRCKAIEQGGEGADNPFLDSQLVLCSVDFLASDSERSRQAIEAGWDMLIVDEAHHLKWSTQKPSEAYQVVELLAQKTEILLLLTATPRQLGPDSHFARLRLLDPDRY
ncbi:MAG: SNF2-related protein, partial [Akkermansiaceae bacterium]